MKSSGEQTWECSLNLQSVSRHSYSLQVSTPSLISLVYLPNPGVDKIFKLWELLGSLGFNCLTNNFAHQPIRAKPGYISDQESAEKFDYKMQKLLWAFACANNCVNPLLYKMMGQKSKLASILSYGKH